MRILVMSDRWFPDTFGGSERVAREIAVRLARRGHDVSVRTHRTEPSQPTREIDSGLLIRRVGWTRAYRYSSRTLALVGTGLTARRAATRADLVVTHHGWSGAGLSLTGMRTPVLHQFHAAQSLEWDLAGADASTRIGGRMARARPVVFRGYRRVLEWAERRTIAQASSLTLLSEFSRGILEQVHGDRHPPVTLIPGGVDVERFRPADDREALRARLGILPSERLLLTVRRLAPRMGLLQLVEAVDRLRERHNDLRVVLAGAGPTEERVRDEITRRGLGGVIEMWGRVSDEQLVDLYQAADLFVLPTQAYEGFGMVTLEALACGTPVLGTPVGATPEILRPLDELLVAPGSDGAAIAEGIAAVLDRGPEALRARSRAHSEAYGWDRVVDRFEALAADTANGTGSWG